jgi:hypothetical protein
VTPEQLLVGTGMVAAITITTDEGTVDADGTVTVTVTRLGGATVSTGPASHSGDADSGKYTYTIAPQTAPDLLTLTWVCTVGGIATTLVTYVEVIGAHYFSLYDLRHSDDQRGSTTATKPIADPDKFSADLLRAARVEAEDEALRCMGHSCVPRASVHRVTGRLCNLIIAPVGYVRAIRKATLITGSVVLDTSAWEVRGVYGNEIYAPGVERGATLELILEHGENGPERGVSEACMLRARHILGRRITNQPETSERARPVDGGGIVFLAQPGKRKTGNTWVDAVYGRHSTHMPGGLG